MFKWLDMQNCLNNNINQRTFVEENWKFTKLSKSKHLLVDARTESSILYMYNTTNTSINTKSQQQMHLTATHIENQDDFLFHLHLTSVSL